MSLAMINPPHQTDAFGAPRTKPVTVTLPLTLLADLDRVAQRMKVSRSSLLTELLAGGVAAMAEIVDTIPSVGATQADVMRAKGKSVALIQTAVKEAQALLKPARKRRRRPRARARPK
jgi:hypothetical protein